MKGTYCSGNGRSGFDNFSYSVSTLFPVVALVFFLQTVMLLSLLFYVRQRHILSFVLCHIDS
jgi:hypothetical protein